MAMKYCAHRLQSDESDDRGRSGAVQKQTREKEEWQKQRIQTMKQK